MQRFTSWFTVALLTLIACLLVIATPPSSASPLPLIQNSDASKWQRYSSDGEELAFLLPEQPVITSVSRPQSFFRKTKPGRMYAAYADGTVYVVMSFDNRNSKDGLDVFIKEFSEYPAFHSDMTFERDASLLGFSGKQYRLKSDKVEGIAQFYLTKNHAYIFEAVSVDINAPAINQFLTTVSLHEEKQSKNPVAAKIAEATIASSSSTLVSSASTAGQDTVKLPIFKQSEIGRRATVVTRPEPGYTEEARKHQITGTVRIRCVLSSTGIVDNVRPTNTLAYGLTEKAIAAAHNLKFIPAVKDGKFVSIYVVIEYVFNLY